MELPAVEDDLRRLCEVLWRYRQRLEDLEYLLDVQGLLVTNGRERWLARVVDQLEVTAAELHELEGQRSAAADRAAHGLGLVGRPTLREITAASPEPWATMLSDHLAWFTPQTGRLGQQIEALRSAVGDGLAGVQELLRGLRRSGGVGYDHGGRPVAHAGASSLLFDDRA